MQKIFDSVRTQYRAAYKRMAFEGHAWNLHRIPGTDQFALFRDDAIFDVELPIAVCDVHALTEARLIEKVQAVIRG